MKFRIVIAIFCSIALHGFLSAQETDNKPFLTDSSRAVQFAIGDYLGVRAFDGKSVSMEWHTTDLRAWRVGVGFSGRSLKSTVLTEEFLDDSLTSSISDDNVRRHLIIEVGAQHLWYFGASEPLYVFLGAGPLVRYTRYEYDGSYNTETLWTFGGSSMIGVEWFVHRRISLHSEYVATFTYSHGKMQSTGTQSNYYGMIKKTTEDGTTNSWDLTSGNVLFGFSVYF
jgi:hypothetical protein